jgi:tetratricopeptide (TPR) repeat protein
VACGFLLGSAMSTAQAPQHAQPLALMTEFRQAVALAEHGDEDGALVRAQQILRQHPDFEPALKLQGAMLEDLGHAQEAAASFEAALKLAPRDPELMLKVAVYQLVAGDRAEALRLLERRLTLVPHDADTLFYLSQAYHLNGENAKALKAIQECLKVDPENVTVWQKYGELLVSSGNNEEALQWLLKAQHADPKLDRIDYDLGVASYKNMDLTNALQYSSIAAERRPNDLNTLELEAAVEVKLGKWDDAQTVYQQILTAKRDDPSALLGLGHCELELKQYQPAADALERLLQQDPTEILAHFYLSRAYAALGRTADAEHEAEIHRTMLQQVSARAPSGDTERQDAVWKDAQKLLAAGNEKGALQLMREKASVPLSTPGTPYVLIGVLYLSMDRPEDARRCLEEALHVDPAVHGAHTYLGIVALQQGELETAEQELKSELAHDPNDQAATAEMGELRYRQGRWAEAADDLAKSRTVIPSLLYLLCDSYFRLGKVKEADLTAELMVDYSKNQPDVVKGVVDLLDRNQQTELAQKLSAKTHL